MVQGIAVQWLRVWLVLHVILLNSFITSLCAFLFFLFLYSFMIKYKPSMIICLSSCRYFQLSVFYSTTCILSVRFWNAQIFTNIELQNIFIIILVTSNFEHTILKRYRDFLIYTPSWCNSYAPKLVPIIYSAIKHGYRCFILK